MTVLLLDHISSSLFLLIDRFISNKTISFGLLVCSLVGARIMSERFRYIYSCMYLFLVR